MYFCSFEQGSPKTYADDVVLQLVHATRTPENALPPDILVVSSCGRPGVCQRFDDSHCLMHRERPHLREHSRPHDVFDVMATIRKEAVETSPEELHIIWKVQGWFEALVSDTLRAGQFPIFVVGVSHVRKRRSTRTPKHWKVRKTARSCSKRKDHRGL